MTTARSLLNWKAAQLALVKIGMSDLAAKLFENRDSTIAKAGGRVCTRLGFDKAVTFCESLTTMTAGELPAMD